MVIFAGNRFRRSLTTLSMMYLSFAVLLIAPSVPATFNNLSVVNTLPNTQKLDASSELLAAQASLQSDSGPAASESLGCTPTGFLIASCTSSISRSLSPLASASSANPGWTKLGAPSPPGLLFASMAYDSADGYVVLFGDVSSQNGAPLSDTWKFSGSVWTEIKPATSPSVRILQAMTYDGADGYIVLFGGFGLPTTPGGQPRSLADTWKFSNGSWTNITGTKGPSPRGATSLAYDALPSDRDVVLFGGLPVLPNGAAIGTTFGDTWRFSGGTWTNITTVPSPSARAGGSMAYDTVDGYALLYGGVSQTGVLGDGWKFSGGSWTSVTSIGNPGPRVLGSMAFDSAAGDNYLVLFGGASAVTNGALSNSLGDTWKFSGGSWTNITGTVGPHAQYGAVMTYDSSQGDGYLLFFGADSASWKFSAGSWTQLTFNIPGPSPRVGASMAYDAADGYVLLFGGAVDTSINPRLLSDTWKFQSGVWTNITTSSGPSAEAYQPMVYDASDGYVLLTAGIVSWAFKAGFWTNISTNCSTSVCPPPRYGSSMMYDAVDGYVVLFGGCCTPSTRDGLRDTWEFHASVWTNITKSTGPSPRLFTVMAYDVVDGYGVLFGGVSSNPTAFPFSGTLGDTWKFAGGSWTNITTTTGPPARTLSTMAYDTTDGYMLLFGGVNGVTAFLGDTWRFIAGTWTNNPTSVSPSARSNGSMVYDDADHYAVLFGGTSSAVGIGDTWTWSQQGLRSWTYRPTPIAPSARIWGSMVYDAADGYVVLFGGQVPSNHNTAKPEYLHDTWKFQAGTWTNITSTAGVPAFAPGGYFPMAYDAADGYVVLNLGDQGGGHTFWKLQGGVWTDITGNCTPMTCPLNRFHSSMTYDAADQRIILFGGINSTSTTRQEIDETWELHAGVWTKLTTSIHPSSRDTSSMAYDSKDGYVVLYGGFALSPPTYQTFRDTWKFVGGTWTNITTTNGPPPGTAYMLSNDPADGYVLLFAGENIASGSSGETWAFSGGAWTKVPTALSPSLRGGPGLAYDDADHYVVLFGGQYNGVELGDTWTWGGVTSTQSNVYVSNSASNTVSIISGSTNTVAATVNVASGPYWSAFDPSNNDVYIANFANYGGSTVTVINTLTNTVVATVTVGTAPVGVAFDSSNNDIYVVNWGSGTVSVISGSTNTVVATVNVGSAPEGVAFDSANNELYVANSGSASVSVINGATNTLVTTVSVGSQPVGVAFDSSTNNVYVANYGGGGGSTVSVISGSTNTVVATVTVGTAPVGVAFDSSNNNVYVTTQGSSTVSVIRDTDNTVIATVTVGVAPTAIAFDASNNNLYVANQGSTTISVISGSTNTVVATVTVGTAPAGVAVAVISVLPSLHPTTTTVSCVPSTVVVAQATICTATVTDTSAAPTTPTGTVNFAPSGTCGLGGTGSSASCSVGITPTSAGTLTVTANYLGDTGHTGSQGSTTVTVNLRPTNTAIGCPATGTVNVPITCTVTVYDQTNGANTPLGSVSFTLGVATCALSGGTCMISITPTAAGPLTVSGTYTPSDGVHASSTGTSGTITVTRSTTTTVSCTPSSVVVNNPATCTVTVTDTSSGTPSTPVGLVSVIDSIQASTTSPCTLSAVSGSATSATCQVQVTPTGAVGTGRLDTITASYTPGATDTVHVTSTGTTTLNVNTLSIHSTTTTVSCTPATITVGQATSCTATVTDTVTSGATIPTGTISFTPGGTTCSLAGTGASASCTATITPTAAGALTVTANYAGDNGHTGSSGQTTITVNLHNTTTRINCTPNPVSTGTATTCTITVTDTETGFELAPTGTVAVETSAATGRFSSPACTLSGAGTSSTCTVTYTPDGSTARTDTITAAYIGDGTHRGSAGSTDVTVTVAAAHPTTTSVTCAPTTITTAQTSLCTATVTDIATGPTTPTGTVTLSFTGTFGTLQPTTCILATGTTAGTATCTSTFTPTSTGTARIVGVYSGDNGHTYSASAAATVTVNAAAHATTTTVTCTPSTVAIGVATSCTATVMDTSGTGATAPTGTVNFTPSGTCTLGTPTTTSASCSVSITPSAAGSLTITATYVPGTDTAHSASSGTTSVTVTINPFDYTLSVTPTSASVVAGGSTSFTITATLTGGTGQAVNIIGSISPIPSVCQPAPGSPPGVSPCGTVTLSPPMITPTSNGATSVVSLTTTSIVPPGTYTFTITGSPSGKSSSSAVFTLTVTAPPPGDFRVSADPTSLTLSSEASENCHGEHNMGPCDDEGQVTITVTSLNGFTGQVGLSVSSSPHIDAQLSKSAIDTSGTSMLQINEASPGIYTVTVTGTSGSIIHRATVTITVRSPEKLKCGGGDNDNCNIESDAPLSNTNFSGHTIHFTMTGGAGTTGAANVTVAKSTVPDIHRIKVRVDGNELRDSDLSITSDDNNYHVYFKVTFHSPVVVDIDLNPSPTILGLDPMIFYGIIGGLALIILGVTAVVYRSRKTSRKIK